jgi:ABC-type Fe3+-hydroxamate transport system substrate-binding protein
MRPVLIPLALAAVAAGLAACGGTSERTVVVNPAPGSTVVVPEHGEPRVVSPPGA